MEFAWINNDIKLSIAVNVSVCGLSYLHVFVSVPRRCEKMGKMGLPRKWVKWKT